MSTDLNNSDSTPEARRLADSAERGMAIARRSFVFFGALFVAGCATSRATQLASSRLPAPEWPDIPEVGVGAPPGAVCLPPKVDPKTGEVQAPAVCFSNGPVPFARPRAAWAAAGDVPNIKGMDPMLPPKYITIHHDGMTPFWGVTDLDARSRLEWIRNGHRGKGWSDIGYHYIVDRSGNVWQGRDVTRWQGAHVKNRNENNIGVMCMGNFMLQRPSAAQIAGLNRTVAQLQRVYQIPTSSVKTHKEWPGAQTLCPGTQLQSKVLALRKSGFKSSALA
jgi:hypothetical protein